MLCAINVLAIFLFLEPISGRSPLYPNIGFGHYQRNLPESSLRQNDEENIKLLMPARDVVSGENVQKLVPADPSSLEVGHAGFEVPYKSPVKKPPKKIGERNAAPENVHRVQEMTGLLWPMGVVPYYIDRNSYDTTTRKRINKAMAAIEAVSCVIFRELEKKPSGDAGAWLHFTNPNKERECRHQFEVVNGGSEVILGFDCLRPEEILHSLLHAVGFRDEVTHPQRDQYIRIMWDNIQPKYRDLFRIQYEDASYKLVEYDPMSIMHFHDRAFSDNGAATIVALIPGLQLTSTTALSQLDIMRLKLAFSHECNKRNVGDLLDTCKNSLHQKKMSSVDHPPEPDYESEDKPNNQKNPDDAIVNGGDNNLNEGENDNSQSDKGDDVENNKTDDNNRLQKLAGPGDRNKKGGFGFRPVYETPKKRG